jgi:mono/diheme cytochrome c family protein
MRLTIFPLLACGLALSSPVPAWAAEGDLAARVETILRTHCGGCHGPGGTGKGGFDYLLDRDRLVARSQVVPGKAADSPLLQRVLEGEMPPGKRPRPGTADLAVLRNWIEAGAPALHPEVPRTLVGEAELSRYVIADLRALEPRRRRFSRYLTLIHLANAGLAEAELQHHRQALSRLVNSLSWHPRLTPPHPIDAARTVFRIDLREYRWNPRLWDRLAAVYPYRLSEGSATARQCAILAGSEQPFVRGDWFLATASRPPFYHDFLQLPSSERALERLLGVDVAGDLQDGTALRAGFNGSGVARNNRILQRHDAVHGAYWRSYDFADNTGRQNVFEHPLGPAAGGSGFSHAGGEIIFHLPNGLQGYLLVDGLGRRVDRAPVEIVSDPKRPDRLVENGLSCMSCHVRGLLPKDDQIRGHVLKNPDAFRAEDRESILALYPPSARLRGLMKEDMERFARALGRLDVPVEEPEPVSAAVLRYEGVLDLREAAAEAGLPPSDFAERLRRASGLARTLGPLLARGGTVQRQVFQDAFPEMARAFHLGAETSTLLAEHQTAEPFSGHRGPVRAVALSPDNKLAVSAGADHFVRLWDVTTGAERQRCEGHTDEVLAVAFAADGKSILSAGRDRSVRLWEMATGKEVRRFTGHTDAVRAVALSPDGRWILSGGDDRTLRLWDRATGKEQGCLTGHASAVASVAFTPDSRLVLSGGLDGSVRLWDVKHGRQVGRWEGHSGAVYAVAFSADGRRALSGGSDRVLRLWDVASGKEVGQFSGHANTIVGVAFTADGKQAISGSSRYGTADRVVRVWDLASGEVRWLDGTPLDGVECLAFTADGKRALLGLSAGPLQLCPLAKKR